MTGKELGKIREAYVGIGGYQDAMLGFYLDFDLNGLGISAWEGFWTTKCTDNCKWTEDDRDGKFVDVMRLVWNTLEDAKVKRVQDLVGVPVEVTIEGNALKSWRILKEVR